MIFSGVAMDDDGVSVYTMNGEACLGGALSGGAFWDGLRSRSNLSSQGKRYVILLANLRVCIGPEIVFCGVHGQVFIAFYKLRQSGSLACSGGICVVWKRWRTRIHGPHCLRPREH